MKLIPVIILLASTLVISHSNALEQLIEQESNDLPIPKIEATYLDELTCSSIPVTLSLTDSMGNPLTHKTGTMTVSLQDNNPNGLICTSSDLSTATTTCQHSPASFPINQEQASGLSLYIASQTTDQLVISDVTFTAVDGMTSTTDADITLTFSPYALILAGEKRTPFTQKIALVAGQASQQTLQMIASERNSFNCTLMPNYQGVHQLTMSPLNYEQPSVAKFPLRFDNQIPTPINHTDYQYQTKKEGESKVHLNFIEGEALVNFVYHDAGKIKFTLSDPAYTWCKKAFDPIHYPTCHPNDLVTLTGSFEVDTRPYTLATCQDTSYPQWPLPHGDVTGGERFVSAGSLFNLVVKPVIWMEGDPQVDPVNTLAQIVDTSEDFSTEPLHSFCSRPITPGFMLSSELDNAPASTIELSSTLDTPSSGSTGRLIASTLSAPFTSAMLNANHNGFLFKELSWNEVGSLNINLKASNYLGLTINPSTVKLGRFYPDHFMVSDMLLLDRDLQMPEFIYVDEPFLVNYRVIAQNLQQGTTVNYDYFSEPLKENIQLYGLFEPEAKNSVLKGSYDPYHITPVMMRTSSSSSSVKQWRNGQLEMSGTDQEWLMPKMAGVPINPYSLWFAVGRDRNKGTADPVPVTLPAAQQTMLNEKNESLVVLTKTSIEFREGRLLLSLKSCSAEERTLLAKVQYYDRAQGGWTLNTLDSRSEILGFSANYDESDPVRNRLNNLNTTGAVYVLKEKTVGPSRVDLTLNKGQAIIFLNRSIDQQEVSLELDEESNSAGSGNYGINLPWLSVSGTKTNTLKLNSTCSHQDPKLLHSYNS